MRVQDDDLVFQAVGLLRPRVPRGRESCLDALIDTGRVTDPAVRTGTDQDPMLPIRPVKVREALGIEYRQAVAILGRKTRETIDGSEEATAYRKLWGVGPWIRVGFDCMGLERGADRPKLSDGAADFLRIALDRLRLGRRNDLDRYTSRKADGPGNDEKDADGLSSTHADIWPERCGEGKAWIGKNRGGNAAST
jgi:hypothetical protein